MFIAKNNDLIILANESREQLEQQLQFIVYTEIVETNVDYILYNGEYKTKSEVADLREKEFYNKFLSTSLGNYRLEPKGYANAQQSIDTINNMVNALGGLTQDIAQMMIFYDAPDFTKSEECTEEWLVAHQRSVSPMTNEEWQTYYIEFTTKYAQKQYQT